MNTALKLVFSLCLLCLSLAQARAQQWNPVYEEGISSSLSGQYKKADSLLRKSLAMAEKELPLGKKDSLYHAILYEIGLNLVNASAKKGVVEILEECKSLCNEREGKKGFLYTKVCMLLGTAYQIAGDFAKSEQQLIEAEKLSKTHHKHDIFLHATACNSLGMLYYNTQDFGKSETWLLLAIKEMRIANGEDNNGYVSTCINLAALYRSMTILDKAEQYYKQAFEKSQIVNAEYPAEISKISNNFASFYKSLGRWSKAAEYFLKALSMAEQSSGVESALFGSICNNLAEVYRLNKKYKEASLYAKRAKEIAFKVYGGMHVQYATACVVLGAVLKDEKQYKEAEQEFNNAADIFQKLLGSKHPAYATCLSGIATVRHMQGDKTEAENLYLKALSIREEALGAYHTELAAAYHNLALFYQETGNPAKAATYYDKLIGNRKKQLSTLFPVLSERERLDFMALIEAQFSNYLAFYSTYNHPESSGKLYDMALFYKGIVFASSQKMKQQIALSNDSTLQTTYSSWIAQRVQLAKVMDLSPAEQQKRGINLKELEEQVLKLEKELSKKTSLLDKQQLSSYKWEQVQEKLPSGSAIIEIVRSIRYGNMSKDTCYVALILTSGKSKTPKLVQIPNASFLESKGIAFYKTCIELKKKDPQSYNSFWKPIQKALDELSPSGFKKLYLSLDGVYHQVNISSLYDGEKNEYIIEKQLIQLLCSSRDLLNLGDGKIEFSKNKDEYAAYLFGYPMYSLDGSNPSQTDSLPSERSVRFSSMQMALGTSVQWPKLEGTKREIDNIKKQFSNKHLKVINLQETEANEQKVKSLKNPLILHIATHGFFLPYVAGGDNESGLEKELLKTSFLRSGLALAGCQSPKADVDDGILTAEEAMNLHLDKTELVVLSACETGLGDIQNGEGVFGLQRSFQQAGAKCIVMSLWKVSDEATQLLMEKFYAGLLSGLSKQEAFRNAQLQLKKDYPSAYYWGAFVMINS